MILSGTTDTQFFYRLKGGHHTHIYSLTCLDDADFDIWLDQSTQFQGPIADIYRSNTTDSDYKATIRKEVGTMTGRIPRELRNLCAAQSGVSCPPDPDTDQMSIYLAAVLHIYLDDLNQRTMNIFNRYLIQFPDLKTGLLGRIFELCTRSNPDVTMDAPFMSLGLIYKAKGKTHFLTPSTRDLLLRGAVERMMQDPLSSMSTELSRRIKVLLGEGCTFCMLFFRILQVRIGLVPGKAPFILLGSLTQFLIHFFRR